MKCVIPWQAGHFALFATTHGVWTLDNGYLLTKRMTALLFYFLFKQENMTIIGVMFVSANFQYFDGGRLT